MYCPTDPTPPGSKVGCTLRNRTHESPGGQNDNTPSREPARNLQRSLVHQTESQGWQRWGWQMTRYITGSFDDSVFTAQRDRDMSVTGAPVTTLCFVCEKGFTCTQREWSEKLARSRGRPCCDACEKSSDIIAEGRRALVTVPGDRADSLAELEQRARDLMEEM